MIYIIFINFNTNKYIIFILSSKYGETPLIKAAWNDHKEIVQILLNHPHIDVNAQDEVHYLNEYFIIYHHSILSLFLFYSCSICFNLSIYRMEQLH